MSEESKKERPAFFPEEMESLRTAKKALLKIRKMDHERRPYIYGLDTLILDLEENIERGRAL